MIAVILPSRGLIFTEVLDSLTRNLEGYDHKFYFSHDLPIPDCENTLVEKAMNDGCTEIFMVEEDTVPPDNCIEKLLKALLEADIAAIDYGVAGWGCITKNKEGEILWCGFGCTMIKRQVFEALEKPYFRSDIELRLNDMAWVPSPKDKYGGQDIYFCTKAREKSFEIIQVEGECKHLKLNSLGKPEINNGLHDIALKDKISKYQII